MFGKNDISTGQKITNRLFTTSFVFFCIYSMLSTAALTIFPILSNFWILDSTGSTVIMGTLVAISSSVGIIMLLFGGIIADQVNKKRFLSILAIISGLSVLALSLMASKGNLVLIFLLSVQIIIEICIGLADPANGAILPEVVPKKNIFRANSSILAITSGIGIIVSVFTGFFYNVGAFFIVLFNAVLFIIAGIIILFVKLRNSNVIDGGNNDDTENMDNDENIEGNQCPESFLSEIKKGFAYIWKNKLLRQIIIIFSVSNLFYKTAYLLLVPFFQKNSAWGIEKYGILIGIYSAGCFVSTLVFSMLKIPPNKRYTLFVSSVYISAIAFALMPIFNNVKFMYFLIFIVGAFKQANLVLLDVMLQVIPPSNILGKVQGVAFFMLALVYPISSFIGGMLAVFLSIRFIIFVGAIMDVFIFLPLIFNGSFKKSLINNF